MHKLIAGRAMVHGLVVSLKKTLITVLLFNIKKYHYCLFLVPLLAWFHRTNQHDVRKDAGNCWAAERLSRFLYL